MSWEAIYTVEGTRHPQRGKDVIVVPLILPHGPKIWNASQLCSVGALSAMSALPAACS